MSDSEDDTQSRTIKITIVGEPATGKVSQCWRYLSFIIICIELLTMPLFLFTLYNCINIYVLET